MALIKLTHLGQHLKPVDNALTDLAPSTKAGATHDEAKAPTLVKPTMAHVNGTAPFRMYEIVTDAGLEQVLRLARLGCKLFPLTPGSKAPMKDFKWKQQATSDEAQLNAWFSNYPNCNWGMATGVKSGVLVLDMDGCDGRESLNSILNEEGAGVPHTLTVTTGRPDSCHFWFTYPGDETAVGNSAGWLGPGLDIRANGGYVLVPPSIHPNGKQYVFTNEALPILPTPRWLLNPLIQSSSFEDERYPAPEPRMIPVGGRTTIPSFVTAAQCGVEARQKRTYGLPHTGKQPL